jgi:hypothetical protein
LLFRWAVVAGALEKSPKHVAGFGLFDHPNHPRDTIGPLRGGRERLAPRFDVQCAKRAPSLQMANLFLEEIFLDCEIRDDALQATGLLVLDGDLAVSGGLRQRRGHHAIPRSSPRSRRGDD